MRISDWSSDVCSSDLSVALMDLERDAETSRTLYISLLTRLKELQRQDQLARADASFVSRAPLAMSPSYPATKRILAVALLARSEERRGGKEWVGPCRYRWSPYH